MATIELPIKIKRCGMAMRLIVGGGAAPAKRAPDPKRIALLVNAHDWAGRLTSGKATGILEIAHQEGVDSSYVNRVVYLACLAPDIVQAIMRGEQLPEINAARLLTELPLKLDWPAQPRLLGLARQATQSASPARCRALLRSRLMASTESHRRPAHLHRSENEPAGPSDCRSTATKEFAAAPKPAPCRPEIEKPATRAGFHTTWRSRRPHAFIPSTSATICAPKLEGLWTSQINDLPVDRRSPTSANGACERHSFDMRLDS